MFSTTISKVLDSYYDNYRTINNSHASTEFDVKVVNSPSAAKVVSKMSKGTYTFGFRDCIYSKQSLTLRVNRKNSLPLITDGLMNLYSIKADEYEDTVFHRAKWVRHKQGAHVVSEKGFIAHRKYKGIDYYYHFNYDGNKLTLNRKKHLKSLLDKKISRQAEEAILSSKYNSIKIGYLDSLAYGNCRAGTISFIDKYGLAKNKKYTVEELIKLCNSREQTIIKAIARHAYRKRKRKKKITNEFIKKMSEELGTNKQEKMQPKRWETKPKVEKKKWSLANIFNMVKIK